jgi:hypothetical protein
MMGWLGWTVIGTVIVMGTLFTMSLMFAASRADDLLLGDRQFETNWIGTEKKDIT